MTTALVPFGEIERMAQAIAKSGLFGIKTSDQCMALMLIAQAQGQHPAIVARDYDIISGRPAKKTEAMLRDFLDAGGSVEWHSMTDTLAEATFSHPKGGTARIDWTIDRAKKAGLAGKDTWQKFPRAMLANRVISEGCRRIYPASTSGLYEPGEVRDMGPEPRAPRAPAEPKDMGTIDAETGEITPTKPAVSAPKASGTGTTSGADPSPAAAPDAAGPDRAADRLVDAEAIAGCATEPELTALVKGMLASAKGDTERKAWIKELGNARDAELTEAFKQ